MMASKFLTHFRSKVKKILPTKNKKKVEDSYDVKDTIGTGNYSVVKLGINRKTNEEVALKFIDKEALQDLERDNILMEIDLLRSCQHPNILGLKEYFEDRKRIVLVTELMKGGELLVHLRKRKMYPEKEACVIIKKLLRAVAYLHKNGIVHRDLKPENLLFTSESEDAEIKIADFGFATHIGNGTLSDPCGSPAYVAPEIVKEEEYDKAVDVWSLGVILYILLCGFPPFYHENTEKIFAQIVKGAYDFPDPYWTKISPGAKDLITRMLKIDPKERITADDALKHSWFSTLSNSNDAISVDTSVGKSSFDSLTPRTIDKYDHKERPKPKSSPNSSLKESTESPASSDSSEELEP